MENMEEKELSLKLDCADPDEQTEKDWMERTGLDQNSLCSAVEALIFLSDKPIKPQKIRNHIDGEKKMPLQAIFDSITRLREDYENSHHGIRLAEVDEGFQFRTKARCSKWVNSLFKSPALALSPVAMEVLAIVAYRQPISRTEIDKIRGVDSSHILRALMDRKLLKVCGRSDDLGRPVVYGTTPQFLELFDFSRLEDLPPEHELSALADNQDVGELSDIKELVKSSAQLQGEFHLSELDELDQLAKTIKEINPGTSFTKSIAKEEKQAQDSEEDHERKSAFEILEDFVSSSMRGAPVAEQSKEVEEEDSSEAKLEQDLDRAFAKLTAESEDEKEEENTSRLNQEDPLSDEIHR